jgi:hypothetical protein
MIQKENGFTAGCREPLRPELRDYLHQGGLFKHPLAIDWVHDIEDCGRLHQLVDWKKSEVANCIRSGDWSHLIWMYERWYRFQALYEHAGSMDDKVFWRCFGEVWHDSEDIRGNKRFFRRLLAQNRPQREQMMNKKERRKLAQLPETITIYRGYSYPTAKKSWSWTFSLHHAKWFARRFVVLSRSPATVAVAEAQSKDVIALLDRGDGGTIVIDPSTVKIKKLLRVKDDMAD